MPIYLPLKGPGNPKPKAPTSDAKGWQKPEYAGVERDYGGWVGMRCDGLVVIDCDEAKHPGARERWEEISGGVKTHVVQSPGGFHYYYRWVPGAPTTPDADIFGNESGIDQRAGLGSYVVVPPTPDYRELDKRKPAPFKVAWLEHSRSSLQASADHEYDESMSWETIPEGRRDDTLTAFAGAFRRQGMAPEVIYQVLAAFTKTIVDQAHDPITAVDLERIVRSVVRYEVQPDWSVELEGDLEAADVIQWMRDMTLPPPAEWHWYPYLPKARLVLLDGAEGIGKGLFCAHLGTTISGRGGTVLWMSTEDDPEEDIQRRLLAAGYSRETSAPIGFFTVDPKFPTHIDEMEQLIQLHEAQLITMDPGRSFLAPPDGVRASFNDEAAIRPGMESINRLAKRSGCTIVFVHHWNKNTQTTTQYRAGGTGAFAQIVRHRVTLAWYGPTIGGSGAFEVSKSNIAPTGHVCGYGVDPISEFDTAAFALGTALDQASIGDWLKDMERDAGDIELDRHDEIVLNVLALHGGAQVPAVEGLRKQYGIKRAQAEAVLDDLEEREAIRRGPNNKWFRVGEGERVSAN